MLTEAQTTTNHVPILIPSTSNPGILLPEPNETVDVPESSFQPSFT